MDVSVVTDVIGGLAAILDFVKELAATGLDLAVTSSVIDEQGGLEGMSSNFSGLSSKS